MDGYHKAWFLSRMTSAIGRVRWGRLSSQRRVPIRHDKTGRRGLGAASVSCGGRFRLCMGTGIGERRNLGKSLAPWFLQQAGAFMRRILPSSVPSWKNVPTAFPALHRPFNSFEIPGCIW